MIFYYCGHNLIKKLYIYLVVINLEGTSPERNADIGIIITLD